MDQGGELIDARITHAKVSRGPYSPMPLNYMMLTSSAETFTRAILLPPILCSSRLSPFLSFLPRPTLLTHLEWVSVTFNIVFHMASWRTGISFMLSWLGILVVGVRSLLWLGAFIIGLFI